MEYNIRAYVDELFRDAPDTQRAYEMKVELVQNLLDKYNDLVASGKTEEDAYNITIYGIGDIAELLEEMRREEPGYPAGGQGATYYKAMYHFRRRSAALTAVAVSLYIFSIIPVIVLGVLSSELHSDYMAALGVAGMFTFAGIATAILIWNTLTKPKHNDPPEIVIDLYNRKKGGGRPMLKAVESGFWVLVVAVYFLLSFLTHRWDITWIIFIAAPAVSAILHTAIERG